MLLPHKMTYEGARQTFVNAVQNCFSETGRIQITQLMRYGFTATINADTLITTVKGRVNSHRFEARVSKAGAVLTVK